MKRVIVIVAIFFSLLYSEEEYKLGEGLQLGSLPLYIGGYISLDYQNRDDYSKFRLDDLAFLAYGGYNKFSYLLEIECKELYVRENNHGRVNKSSDSNLYVERLYLDWAYDENYSLRVGKYNSPIGFWNLLPINVLRETTSSPKSTYIVFPKFTTGISGSYSSYGKGEMKVDLIFQYNNDLDDDYNNYKIDEHYGFGISFEENDFTYKLNLGSFHSRADFIKDELYYLLLSGKYERNSYQILAELGTQKSSNEFTTKYAGYIQGLYRFSEQHIGILRAEAYDNEQRGVSDEMFIFGYTYRPVYPVAIKSEFQFHSQDRLNQFLFSVSVLF